MLDVKKWQLLHNYTEPLAKTGKTQKLVFVLNN